MRKTITAAGVAVGVVATLGFAVPAQAVSATEADLYVLHAVPDRTVDVYVNDDLTLDDFTPGTLTEAIALPAGDYKVDITAANAMDNSAPVLTATLSLAAGTSYTATANLDAAGDPALNLFTNDISTTAAGEGRLTVRHIAAAPAVDILAGGTPVIEGLENPEQATLDLPAGTVDAAVAAAGTTAPVLGPAPVAIEDGVLTIVYAWGSLDDGNLALASQTIAVGHSTPNGVISGTAGYAAQNDAAVQTSWIAGGLAALVAAAAGIFAFSRRIRIES